ncbi:hypothetical protein CFY87_02175 [Actinobacillus seminis]|uniref:Outer membrane chaperone Skp n=1 Tax=Actinobacillus seminis TaxID=722 RepID=A0A263HF43_9PAST|nr:OmpH family outer membrane protein [Actinobacillus seminis]OZN26025.1 hypothetical protein CFY87_02175 [Actinobacillus seminis]SUU34324.1 outer membrane chaperone Skp [Actinobacillus seminis]
MKKAVKLTALSLGLALASSFAMAEENIAFLNVDYAFVNNPTRQAELKKMDKEFKAPADKLKADEKVLQDKKASFEKEIDDKAKAIDKEIESKVKSLEKDAPKLRQADIKKRQDGISALAKKRQGEIQELISQRNADFNKLVEEHQKNVAKFQADVQQREREINQKALVEIQKTATDIAKAKNFSIVLDEKTVVYTVEGKDITEDVLKALPQPATSTTKQAK